MIKLNKRMHGTIDLRVASQINHELWSLELPAYSYGDYGDQIYVATLLYK